MNTIKQQKVQTTVDIQLGENFEAIWQIQKGQRGWFAYVRNVDLLTRDEPRVWFLGRTVKEAVAFRNPSK